MPRKNADKQLGTLTSENKTSDSSQSSGTEILESSGSQIPGLDSDDNCHACKTPYEIPGLDSNKCPRCGWVFTLEYLRYLQEQKEARKKRKKKGNPENKEESGTGIDFQLENQIGAVDWRVYD